MRIKDFLRFLLCFGLFYLALTYIINANKPKQEDKPKKQPDKIVSRSTGRMRAAPATVIAGLAGHLAMESLIEKQRKLVQERPLEASKQFTLGSRADDSPFHLEVEFDSRGGAVRQLILNKFKTASRLGKPVNVPLVLIPAPEAIPAVPGVMAQQTPLAANVFYHFDVNNPDDARPKEELGGTLWKVVQSETGNTDEHSITFETNVQGVIVTKTYRLQKQSYHLELEVKLKRTSEMPEGKKFRYQLTGGRGLPIEGEWFTSIFRHSLIGQLEGDSLWRNFQDLREITHKQGGTSVDSSDKRLLQYAAVAVQYFASVVVVDNKQVEGQSRDFLQSARPTLETRIVRGELTEPIRPGDRFLSLQDSRDRTKPPEELVLTPEVSAALASGSWKRGDKIALKVIPTADDKLLAIENLDPNRAQELFTDDITVRVNTKPIDLPESGEVTHKYLLYNGPMKAMLLGQMSGESEVPNDLVNRYVDTLHLNTLTDYHSPGFFGNIASKIWLTNLIILFTNLCHRILHLLHLIIPSYGICIILLTVIVRGAMFPLSRKQAMTGMKMQELAPELKKLKEKFKDDRQAFAMAQMDLFRKHGVNPLGSCWMIFLQLPIFMGLYYCLQESIFFRLAPFLYIQNLAAPDMLVWWSENIPLISRPQDYGSLIYLGPFLNILPIVAVTLMIFQQKMLMPPPTDDQAAMQQKMMKYMMIFMALLFYKVAAGLAIYFIASSLWGFAERKWLPKKKPTTDGESADSLYLKMRGDAPADKPREEPRPANNGNYTAANNRAKRRQDRKKQRERGNAPAPSSESPTPANEPQGTGWWARMREWWQDVLKKAAKK